MLERREAARLGVEMREVEAPAELLFAAVLAHKAVQPALQASRQTEIVAVDGEDERVIEHRAVEPVGHDEFEAEWPATMVRALLPFVDPGEAVHPPLGRLADRGGDRCRLEPVERGLQPVVVAERHAASDEVQDFIGRGRHEARRAQADVTSLDDLRGRPDQDICVPDRRHAVFGDGFDADFHRARLEVDRRQALRLGQREERIGHEVLRVARRKIAGQRPEQIELRTLVAMLVAGRHGAPSQRGKRPPAVAEDFG